MLRARPCRPGAACSRRGPGPTRIARGRDERCASGGRSGRRAREGSTALRQARHDVHVAGWALALMRCVGEPGAACAARARRFSSRRAARRSSDALRSAPADLRLPGGRVPHDFTRASAPASRSRWSASRRFARTRVDRSCHGAAASTCSSSSTIAFRAAPARQSSSAMTTFSPAGRRTRAATESAERRSRWSCSSVATGHARGGAPSSLISRCGRAVPMPASIRSTGSTRAGSGCCLSPSATCTRACGAHTACRDCRPPCASSRRTGIRAPERRVVEAARDSRLSASGVDTLARRLAVPCSCLVASRSCHSPDGRMTQSPSSASPARLRVGNHGNALAEPKLGSRRHVTAACLQLCSQASR